MSFSKLGSVIVALSEHRLYYFTDVGTFRRIHTIVLGFTDVGTFALLECTSKGGFMGVSTFTSISVCFWIYRCCYVRSYLLMLLGLRTLAHSLSFNLRFEFSDVGTYAHIY